MSSSVSTKVERRKLRRGTTSCWECKRRKTRCHFEQSSSSACVSCKRRGCKCVLQHIEEQFLVPEAADQPIRNRDVGEQVDRLEGLADRLVRRSTIPSTSIRDSDPPLQERNPSQEKQSRTSVDDATQKTRQPQASFNSRRKLLPKLDKAPAENSSFPLDNSFKSLNPATQMPIAHRSPRKILTDSSRLPPDPSSGSLRCSSLTLLLQSILPSVNITTRIMHHNKLLMMSMHVFRGLSTDPFRPTLPRQVSRLASPTPTNPKPIDLARSLFQLAICLQQSDRTSEISELCLDRSNSDVAGQYFEAASRYVTSQDSLVVSFEGIETLMLEGLYHVSTGQIRLAWLVFRRALGIAHLMGLHIPQRRRHNKQPRATNFQTQVCLATLWFRLIFMDRYLSLVLCLPMSVRDDSFMEDLVEQEPHEKLERTQAKLTSRIISRNELMRHGHWADEFIYNHYNETKDIDYALKQAARSLSADWWAFPRLKDARTNAELKDTTAKVVLQLHHYNLVLLLHLPYVVPRLGNCLANEASQDYTNSKLSAMFASRELLTRSIIPVGPNRVSSSTRGNILKIVLSALTLLLAHLDSHRLGRENILDHQRPGDLLIVERAIKSLESVADKYDDALCYSAARALKKLGAIEATAADGVGYRALSEPSEIMHMECMVREEENHVKMSFPYVGTIHILRQDPQEAVPTISVGSHTTVETGNLDGSLLTPRWASSDSSSSWPELTSTALSISNTQDAFNSAVFANYGMQDTWNLQNGDLECVEALPASRLFSQDYGLHGWDLNGQRSLILEESIDTDDTRS